jgi:hypothetical protein
MTNENQVSKAVLRVGLRWQDVLDCASPALGIPPSRGMSIKTEMHSVGNIARARMDSSSSGPSGTSNSERARRRLEEAVEGALDSPSPLLDPSASPS